MQRYGALSTTKCDTRNLPRAIPYKIRERTRLQYKRRRISSDGNMSGPREKIRPHC